MIPKKIHYCWFGKNQLDKLALRCIATWRKHCPDYEIIELNEKNFDVYSTAYTKQAYDAKKYAFVSDFARFDILYKEGGIYLDVDVELLKPLDPLLQNKAYMGFEEETYVNPGLGFGSVAGHSLLGDILEKYHQRVFIDDEGRYDYTTVVHTVTNILLGKGLVDNNQLQTIQDCTIYPKDFLQPVDIKSNKTFITQNTYSIHHYASSWYPTHRKILKKLSKIAGPQMKHFVRKLIKRKW